MTNNAGVQHDLSNTEIFFQLNPSPVDETPEAYAAWEKKLMKAKEADALIEKERLSLYSKKSQPEIPVRHIYPYHNHSRGAVLLGKEMGIDVVRRDLAMLVYNQLPDKETKILNWGSGSMSTIDGPGKSKTIVLNPANRVSVAYMRKQMFEALATKKIPLPEFTSKFDVAATWVREGKTVIGRSNDEIVFYDDNLEEFVNSNLWVMYKKRTADFRVHVVRDKMIFVQDKTLRDKDPDGNPIDPTKVDHRIRTLQNGFVYRTCTSDVPDMVVKAAIDSISALKLDFGAVDVIYNKPMGTCFVLDVEPSPMLNEEVAAAYAKGLKPLMA